MPNPPKPVLPAYAVATSGLAPVKRRLRLTNLRLCRLVTARMVMAGLVLAGLVVPGIVIAGLPTTGIAQASAQPTGHAAEPTAAAVQASAHACGPTNIANGAPWPEFGGNNSHSQIATGTTAAGALRRHWETAQLDGAMYGEPLVGGGCVYVATENNSIYAFSAATGAFVWRTHIARPVTSGLACSGDISPSGISGTPVLDATSDELWAVVFTDISGRPEHEIVALDAQTGHVMRRQELSLPGTDPTAEQQRAALDLDRGNVYVALGGLYGDCGNYKGGIVSVPENSARGLGYWSTPTKREGAVWEVGGPAVLPDGDLLFATGNSAASPGQPFDGGDAVINLTGGLHMSSYFAPTQWAHWNLSDQDMGTSGPAILPGGLVLQVGKPGEGFLMAISHLGGIGRQLAALQVCTNGGAYGADAVAGATVYVPCSNGIVAVAVKGHSLRVLWRSSVGGAGSVLVAGGRVFEQVQGGQLFAVNTANGRALQTLSLSAPTTHFPWVVAVGTTLYAADGTKLEAFAGA
ncbi:MAG TPA: PQQ-binding-like beta-propeller repeat protein [Acidimicrobiales bacterium]|nr:PQQ-binding-like beta-propeller repeat protein [Acidimicrobiales bacterium]